MMYIVQHLCVPKPAMNGSQTDEPLYDSPAPYPLGHRPFSALAELYGLKSLEIDRNCLDLLLIIKIVN